MKRDSGFSLIEVIVTLVITSLLIAVLSSALFSLAQVQSSLTGVIAAQEAEKQALSLWRRSVQHVVSYESRFAHKAEEFAGRTNPYFGARGSETEFRIETTAGLEAPLRNAPVFVTFVLKRDSASVFDEPRMQLVFKQGNSELVLHRFQAASAKFSYRSRTGVDSPVWPPLDDLKAVNPQTVTLTLESAERGVPKRFFVAAVDADTWVPPDTRSVLGPLSR
jgi:prepilin-type N-terminal cleavage/methylation domain-containing protein